MTQFAENGCNCRFGSERSGAKVDTLAAVLAKPFYFIGNKAALWANTNQCGFARVGDTDRLFCAMIS